MPTAKLYDHPTKFGPFPSGLESGPNPPDDGGMDARVAKLEDHVGQLRVDVGVMKERLDHTATKTWVLGGAVTTLVGLLAVAWWMAQQYLGPILQALGKH